MLPTESLSIHEYVGNLVNYYTLIVGILGGWFLRILYIFFRKTSVTVFGTKIDLPYDTDINRSLGFFRKQVAKVNLIENLDNQNHLEYFDRLNDFYYRNQSKIRDLLDSSHVSLFLLAHQSLITKLGYDFQDQKSVTLYHRLRDTYGSYWSWERWYHLRLITLLSGWKNHVLGWKLNLIKSPTLDYSKDILIKFQISFPVSSSIDGIDASNFIEINLEKDGHIGNKSYLRYYSQLGKFEDYFRNIWKEININLGRSGKEVHMVMNVPAPFAFIIGRNIHSIGPTVHLYEEKNGKYEEIFILKKP